MSKGKAKKHSAASMNKKSKESTENKGGGKAGAKDRKGGKAGHSKFKW